MRFLPFWKLHLIFQLFPDTFFMFQYLTISIRGENVSDLSGALEQWMKGNLEGVYPCQQCNVPMVVSKKNIFYHPSYLLIIIERIYEEKRLLKKIFINDLLNQNGIQYKLKGLLDHIGHGASKDGSYRTYLYDQHSIPYVLYPLSSEKAVEIEMLKLTQPQILLYERIGNYM